MLISYFIEHTLNRDTSDCVMVELIFSYLLLRLVVVRAMYDICDAILINGAAVASVTVRE